MARQSDDAARPRNNEHDNQKANADGKPPRPATEPAGSAWSTKSAATATDPATGEPSQPARRRKT